MIRRSSRPCVGRALSGRSHRCATSGDWLDLVDVRVNCEQNSLLYRVRPKGGVCHTKDAQGHTRKRCYYRSLKDLDSLAEPD